MFIETIDGYGVTRDGERTKFDLDQFPDDLILVNEADEKGRYEQLSVEEISRYHHLRNLASVTHDAILHGTCALDDEGELLIDDLGDVTVISDTPPEGYGRVPLHGVVNVEVKGLVGANKYLEYAEEGHEGLSLDEAIEFYLLRERMDVWDMFDGYLANILVEGGVEIDPATFPDIREEVLSLRRFVVNPYRDPDSPLFKG